MSILAAFAVPHPPLIVPGVGHGREKGISATMAAYREVARRIADLAPETIVISSPHATMYLDYLHISSGAGARGSFARFDDLADGSRVTYDEEFVAALCQAAASCGLPAGTEGEREPALDWGVLVPLHFVQEEYAARKAAGKSTKGEGGNPPAYRVVRIGLSGLSPRDHYRLGELVQQVAGALDRRIVYVASGDLSHKLAADGPYGYAPEGPVFDGYVCRAFETGDFLALLTADPSMCERAAECGLRSFQIMAGALDRTPVRPELLSHEGPFGVGYGVAAFTPTGPTGSDPARAFGEQYEAWHADDMARRKREESPYVQLARFALELYVRKRQRPTLPAGYAEAQTWAREGRAAADDGDPRTPPAALLGSLPPEAFSTRAGAFVSLKKNGQLRGCIGTILPTREALAAEICANAVSAGCRDPRFSPVEAGELGELVYDVDVLSAPEDIAGPEELDPARYGVIVSCDGRRGLLLPDLDGVDTVDEQVRIAARKGGIDLADPDVRFQRFTVTRYV